MKLSALLEQHQDLFRVAIGYDDHVSGYDLTVDQVNQLVTLKTIDDVNTFIVDVGVFVDSDHEVQDADHFINLAYASSESDELQDLKHAVIDWSGVM